MTNKISSSTLIAGPNGEAATQRALAWADDEAGQQPRSILLLTQSQDRAITIADQWHESHNQLRLHTATLDGFVSECYESETRGADGGSLPRSHRLRLVEAAIERHDSSGVLADIDQPNPELVEQIQGLFSLLEYAGYTDAESIENALHTAGITGDDIFDPATPYGSFRGSTISDEHSPLADQATTVSTIYAEYQSIREDTRPDWETVTAERYFELLDSDSLIDAVPESVDAIVFDGLTRLAPLERTAIQRLNQARPAVAVLPLINTDPQGAGLDKGVAQSLSIYRALGFQLHYDLSPDTDEQRLNALRQLGVHATSRPSYQGSEIGLRRWTPATERDEVRTTARRVRELLAKDVDPAEIGIVVTDRTTYRSQLAEVLSAYDIPFTFVNKIGFEQTLVGDLLLSLLNIADETDGGLALGALAGNCLMSLGAFDIDEEAIKRATPKMDDGSIDALQTALENITGDQDVTCEEVGELQRSITTGETLAELLDTIEEILSTANVDQAVETYCQQDSTQSSYRLAFESSAWSAVNRVMDSFRDGPTIHAEAPATRLRQALLAELVGGPQQQPGYVRVLPLTETTMHSFEHLFVLGLTAGYVPTESDRMAYFEAINEADEEFSRAHTGRRSRYLLGTLLSGSTQAVLSSPRHTVDGTEHTTAPILAELERYVDFDSDGEQPAPLVENEDVQRQFASWATRETFEQPEEATTPLADVRGLADDAMQFAESGVTASWRRSQPGVTPHEAQLGNTFEEIFSRSAVEPFSPSALEDYARCPFLYFCKRVLGYEEEYDDDAEITRGDRGTYVHETLARFYRRLRTEVNKPIDITEFDRSTLEDHLLKAALKELEDFEPIGSLFARRTVTRLLAGLGDPDANKYYSRRLATSADQGSHGGIQRGVFMRFLDEELDVSDNREIQPTYFEAAVNLNYSGTEVLQDDPVTLDTEYGSVDIRGIADRLDTHATDGYFSVVDYKTGRTPSKTDVKLGTKLQLPLYGLVFESVLDETDGVVDSHVTVAGTYYNLSSPSDVDSDDTFISSSESQYGDAALVAGTGRPVFDSQREFTRFVRNVTASRVGNIAAGIEAGAFEPTLQDESHANCDSCSFNDVCDVRNHHRRETIARVDADEHYISERASNEELDLDAYPAGGDD